MKWESEGAKRNDNYEKYLPLHEDGRVSKQHCVIIQRGDCLYLMDDGSKNGTYLNGILVDRPTEVQREDVIGVGGDQTGDSQNFKRK